MSYQHPKCKICQTNTHVSTLGRDSNTPTHRCSYCGSIWGLGWEIVQDVNNAFAHLFSPHWVTQDKQKRDIEHAIMNKLYAQM